MWCCTSPSPTSSKTAAANLYGRFVLKGRNQVSFDLGRYDHSRELVIDPTVTYATYLGGLAEDDGLGIAFDTSGATYVTGNSNQQTFPLDSGSAPILTPVASTPS